MREFTGKTVLVTGSVRNTGLAIARAFIAEGASVYVNGREAQKTQGVVDGLNGEGLPGRALVGACDVSKPEQIAALFRLISDAGAGLDVLVNNAVIQGIGGAFGEVEDAMLEEVFRTNVFGYFRCGQEAARIMKKQGRGAIVNVSSNTATRAIHNRSAYVASKGAIDALTRAMATDLGAFGIRVNTVAPGYINTDRWELLDPQVAERRRKNIPLGAEATGEDVAQAVLYMASARAGNVSGSRLVVDGGCCAQHLPADCDF